MNKTKPDTSDQHKRFIETARELGCDEDEAAFDEKLRRIATIKPKSKPAPNAKRAQRSRTQPDEERG
jgi:hypothetical protein